MVSLRLRTPHLSSLRRCLPPLGERRYASSTSRSLQVTEEIQQAVAERRPVVALETTIYTHGFPYPDNLALASRLESLVREHGGVPATIGILDGIARVGLQRDELDRLVSSAGSPNLLKVSRRDLGFVCGLTTADGKRFNGGTTIAGTMILAHLAGIRIFGTGGLGGVHRGAESTMDVSADLTELGRTPVAVISSGCKSFLDLPRTLEVLETNGVAVATFADGRSGKVDMPGFYTRESDVPSPKVLKDELEAARVLHAHFSLGLQSGLHFANPIPEAHSVPKDAMDRAIQEAIEHADAVGSTGAAITPYILDKIKEITGNKSVEANRALVEANVIRAAKVANELYRLEMEDASSAKNDSSVVVGPAAASFTPSGAMRSLNAWAAQQPTPSTSATDSKPGMSPTTSPPSNLEKDPLKWSTSRSCVFVAGSVAIDLSCDYALQDYGRASGGATLKPALHTSNPAVITQSLGGVGGNLARAAHLLGANVTLCSAVGNDLAGAAVLEALGEAGMNAANVQTLVEERTAQYVAVNDSSKDLMLAMADMGILESGSDQARGIGYALDTYWLLELARMHPPYLVLDGNWASDYLAAWLKGATSMEAKRPYTVFEPVSTAKSARIFRLPQPHALGTFPSPAVDLTTPNRYELASMHAAAREGGFFERTDWWEVIDALGIPQTGARAQMTMATNKQMVDDGIPQQVVQLLPFFPAICTKLGSEGVLLTQILPAGDARLRSSEYAPYILSRCGNNTEETLGVGGVYMRLFPPSEAVDEEEVVSVNGVGDTFVGTLVAGMAKAKEEGKEPRVEDFIDVAQKAAVMTLKSRESVAPGLAALRSLL